MKQFYLLFISIILFTVYSCKDSGSNSSVDETNTETEETHHGHVSEANALQVAESLPDFTTLVAAIKAAGVEDAVVNAGPLTVFAPTNDAFAKLPAGTVEDLLKPENKAKLAYILTNHVAPANYPDTQLEKDAERGRKLYMASGQYLDVLKKDDGIYVGSTKILKTVKVSNGWVHVIGDVLVPKQ